jgi:hypothetical protein
MSDAEGPLDNSSLDRNVPSPRVEGDAVDQDSKYGIAFAL